MDMLEERIDRLERQNRRMKLAGVVVVTIVAAYLLMGWVSPGSQIMKGEKLIINDDEGRVRVSIEATQQGAIMAFHDNNGGIRLCLEVTGQESNLRLKDEDGRLRVLLGLKESGPGLALLDEGGIERANLAIMDGYPYVEFNDKKGDSCAGLSIFGQGPELWLLNEKDSAISTRMGVTPEPYLIMKDDLGLRASLHLLGNSPHLVFLGRHIRSLDDITEDKWVRLHLGIKEKEPVIELIDDKGKTIFKEPK